VLAQTDHPIASINSSDIGSFTIAPEWDISPIEARPAVQANPPWQRDVPYLNGLASPGGIQDCKVNNELPRIASVAVAGDRTLCVVWRGGVRTVIDLRGWISTGQLSQLERSEIFGTAAVVDHGAAVQWSGDEDLAIDAGHLCLLANQCSERLAT
jgi:Protein of unknown function (DUF2442)